MIYLTPIIYAYILWLLFLAVMALNWRWHALPKSVRAIALPAALTAVLLDFLFNITIGTLLFLDLPRQWTFSQRVGQYKRRIDWRAPLAEWICSNLLDPFEVDGAHCKG